MPCWGDDTGTAIAGADVTSEDEETLAELRKEELLLLHQAGIAVLQTLIKAAEGQQDSDSILKMAQAYHTLGGQHLRRASQS